MVLHVAAHGRVAGHRAELRLLLRDGKEVVVVELHRPARVLGVERVDLRAERVRDERMRARVAMHLAREGREGIGRIAGGVVPALDGLEGEA